MQMKWNLSNKNKFDEFDEKKKNSLLAMSQVEFFCFESLVYLEI